MPKQAIIDREVPVDRPFKLVYTVEIDVSGTKAYMDVVYEVSLARQIRTAFGFERNVIDLKEESQRISALGSRY